MYFGAHVSAAGGLDKTLDRAREMGAEAVQLFTQSPRMWKPTNHDPETFVRFKERRVELGIPDGGVVAHALYLCNLAAPDDVVYEKSRSAMRNTMEVACAIEADGVIFHVGSHLGAGMDVGIERVIPALNEVLELCNDRTWLLMENSAGAGGTIGRSIDELVTLFEAADGPRAARHLSRHVPSLCLGRRCHRPKVVDALVDDIDARIGLDRLRALHINDAAAPLGSNRDRHANIGEGEIGEEMGVFLSHPKLQGLPAFLEVPGVDKKGPNADELRKAREIHQRWVATAG